MENQYIEILFKEKDHYKIEVNGQLIEVSIKEGKIIEKFINIYSNVKTSVLRKKDKKMNIGNEIAAGSREIEKAIATNI